MDRTEYLKAVEDFMYQGEVLGEAMLDAYVAREKDPVRRYKWATIMQLECETKARLRPFLAQLGLSLVQRDTREQVAKIVENYETKSWTRHMEETVKVTNIYIKKFEEIEAASPDSERAVTHSMVLHEAAIKRFAELELAGDSAKSLNDVIAQLHFPLPRP